MTYKHWKELRLMLNEIADQYEEQRALQKATEDIECNKGKTKEGTSIKIGYMFTAYRKCSCVYLTPRDSNTWSDDEEEEDGDLRDRGGRYQNFLPCGEMLVVSVALQENQPLSQPKESQDKDVDLQSLSGSQAEGRTSFMSPARTDRQLLRALDSSLVFTNTISDYFESGQKKTVSQVLSAQSESTSEETLKDKQSVLKNMANKSRMKHGKRKIGSSSTSTYSSTENEFTNKRQVTKSIFDTDSNFSNDTSPLGHDTANFDYIFTEEFAQCEYLPAVVENSDNILKISKEFEHSLHTNNCAVYSGSNLLHKTQDKSVSNLKSSVFAQNDHGIKASTDKAKSPCGNLTKDISCTGDEKEPYSLQSPAGNTMQTSTNKSCSPVLKRRSKNHTLSYFLQVSTDLSESKHEDLCLKRNVATEKRKETSPSYMDKCDTSDLFSPDSIITQDVSCKSAEDFQIMVKPEHRKRDRRARKLNGPETVKAKMKLKVLFGDSEMPPSEVEDHNERKDSPESICSVDRESITKRLKPGAVAEHHRTDDASTFRRSHRIKQNKDKVALIEKNKYCDENTSDLNTSESTGTDAQSQSSQEADSPHSKQQPDNTILNISDVLISSRKVRKICSSAKTIKAIAELDRIRKDMEKLDELHNDDDLLSSSQNSCKDFVTNKPKKGRLLCKKTVNILANQSKLDSWITPKENSNKGDKQSEEVTSKIKSKKNEATLEIKNTGKREDRTSKIIKSTKSEVTSKTKNTKKSKERTQENSVQKSIKRQRTGTSMVTDSKKNKKGLFELFRTREIASDDSVSWKGSNVNDNQTSSSSDYGHTREKMGNTDNSDMELSSCSLDINHTLPSSPNLEISLGDTFRLEADNPCDSCSLPDIDLNRECQSESDDDSSEAQDNHQSQDLTKSHDQRLFADEDNSDDLNLRYDPSSPNSPHESFNEDEELPNGDNNKASKDASSISSLIAIRNRLSAISLEDLELRMQDVLPYLKKIMKGREPNRRHEIFREGGREFRNMSDELIYGPFSEEQILHAIECLEREFSKIVAKACGKHKVNQYLWKVLAPTFFIRIVMENEKLTSSEAEKTLAEISLNKTINNKGHCII
ncbi:titin homolog isoform X2 [Penaeus chinensis]|nr:titin homolog isoform X2 [Penaeus chinensis]XP_047476840.1 titin homolog isoform X2 [Penaeus chinensis]